ncbi:response regulator transcription factor [Acetivibrio cellulolyticus]|uniref:response regulator transcription factor n=1 Tax=Acetivibrio cellulolyticus TaxID=35830 RepID=UPI0001E2D915|nr:response regulator transcription factor [Acetivibrio cellulolyticus]
MRILIVEDEIRLADTLREIMLENKYIVDVVYNGADGLDYAMTGVYDVIVLDVMLPKINGFEVVKTMRKNKLQTPVILLTAKDEVSDKIAGLDSGADDYLTKPFVPDELLARIRALSRRQGEIIMDSMQFSDLSLNLATYMLECGSKSVHLGYKEFEILRLLMLNPTMVVPKETLITRVWGDESDAEDNNVEVYISFLRKKFSYLGSKATVSTVRKIGYFLEEAP